MTHWELEQQLVRAEEQVRVAQETLRIKGREGWNEALEANAALASAQRALAAAKGEEYAVPYDIGFEPESAVPGPVILQTDHAVVLTFNSIRLMSDAPVHGSGCGIVYCDICLLTRYGLPNDEAMAGHPLFAKGLNDSGVYEVINSSWIRQVTERNRIAFPNNSEWIATKRHFIFVLKDKTFECIANGLRASVSILSFESIFAEVVRCVVRT